MKGQLRERRCCCHLEQESLCGVHSHHEVENVFNALKHDLPVIDLYVEFIFDRVVDQNTGAEAVLFLFVVPVGSERDWNSVPSVWVDVAQSVAAAPDDALDEDVRLLLQVQMVLVWVIEVAEGDLRHEHRIGLEKELSLRRGNLGKTFLHHLY
jgi:hypothetical protein